MVLVVVIATSAAARSPDPYTGSGPILFHWSGQNAHIGSDRVWPMKKNGPGQISASYAAVCEHRLERIVCEWTSQVHGSGRKHVSRQRRWPTRRMTEHIEDFDTR